MISIALKRRDFLVAEKPAGISTQPLPKKRKGVRPALLADAPTLASELAKQFPKLKKVGGSDWGACHRLDRETSGLVLFARSQKIYDYFRKQFSRNRIEKEYLALVHGTIFKKGKIEFPIGEGKSSKKVKVYRNLKEARKNRASEAVTIYEPFRETRDYRPQTRDPENSGVALIANGQWSMLRIKIKTGCRHQIRAHLASIGHPIVGDLLYGNKSAESSHNIRLHLHAARIKFHPPEKQRAVEVSSKPSFLPTS